VEGVFDFLICCGAARETEAFETRFFYYENVGKHPTYKMGPDELAEHPDPTGGDRFSY